MSFTVNGRTLATPKIESVIGQRGLRSFRLLFRVTLAFPPRDEGDEATLLDLTGQVMVRGRGGGPHYLGRVVSWRDPVLVDVRGYRGSTTSELALDLDLARVEALEELRLGEGLDFRVTLWARVQSKSGYSNLSEELSFSVNQGTWVELLGQMGYGRIMLLEVPVPDEDGSPELVAATTHLANAQKEMELGHYREAVGTCRDVLEALSVALNDRDDQDEEFRSLFEKTRDKDKAARLRVLRRAFKVLCHPARHADEVSARIDWDRLDAFAAIIMAGTIIRWSAQGSREGTST